MLLKMAMETIVFSDWFECVLVISFYVAKVFSGHLVVFLFHAIDDIGRSAMY